MKTIISLAIFVYTLPFTIAGILFCIAAGAFLSGLQFGRKIVDWWAAK